MKQVSSPGLMHDKNYLFIIVRVSKYTLDTSSLWLETFHPILCVIFSFSWCCSLKHKSFRFWRSLIYFSLIACALMSHIRNHCQIQTHENLFLCFFKEFYSFSSYILWPILSYFCIWYEVGVQLHSFVGFQLSQHHSLKGRFFPTLNSLGILVENQLTINARVCFWTLCSIPLNCVSTTLFWLL